MIINIGKHKPTNNKSVKVELTKHVEPARSAFLSYINENGKEIIYNGPYNKTINGYSFSYNDKKEYEILSGIENSYLTGNSYFSYMDKDGYERTFNKIESLEFNEELNTYTGEIDIINYEDKEIVIFEE